jgi:hypothetical protein
MFKPGDKVLVEGIVRYDLEDVGKGVRYVIDLPDLQVVSIEEKFIKKEVNHEIK